MLVFGGCTCKPFQHHIDQLSSKKRNRISTLLTELSKGGKKHTPQKKKAVASVDGRNPLQHLGCMKPCQQWDKLPTSTGDRRISSINSICYEKNTP